MIPGGHVSLVTLTFVVAATSLAADSWPSCTGKTLLSEYELWGIEDGADRVTETFERSCEVTGG